jgi:hypothetical protein
MDLLLTLAGLGNIVGGLHPHECVHFHSKGFLNAERHIPGKVSLSVNLNQLSGNSLVWVYGRFLREVHGDTDRRASAP